MRKYYIAPTSFLKMIADEGWIIISILLKLYLYCVEFFLLLSFFNCQMHVLPKQFSSTIVINPINL